jgi:hypothetical protein
MTHTTVSESASIAAAHPVSLPSFGACWRTALWSGLVLLGVYLLINGGQTFISDGELMLITTARIADEQTITLPEDAEAFPQTVRGQGGFLFSRYGLGQPMAAAVLYLFGVYVVGMGLFPDAEAYILGRFFALLLPAIATAITGGVLTMWAARLYRSVWLGAALGLVYGLGTLALPYSRFFFSEPLYTCCLVVAAYAIYERFPLPAGLAFGYALATRLVGVFVFPVLVLYLWLQRRRWRDLIWFGIGIVPGIGMIVLNNWVRFRALYEYGYGDEGFTGNLFEGIAGLLVSPGKSVFLYVPLLLALPFAARPFWRRFPNEAILIAALSLTILVQSSLWWIWWGGWGWGPRFLVPLMPFLILPFGVLLMQRRWQWIIGAALLPLSIGINMLGVLVDFNPYLADITQGSHAREQIYLWQPLASPILEHIRRLDFSAVPIISFHLSRSDIGFPERVAGMLSTSILVLIVGSLAGLWYTLRRATMHQNIKNRVQ